MPKTTDQLRSEYKASFKKAVSSGYTGSMAEFNDRCLEELRSVSREFDSTMVLSPAAWTWAAKQVAEIWKIRKLNAA